jgi:hypothetical protein
MITNNVEKTNKFRKKACLFSFLWLSLHKTTPGEERSREKEMQATSRNDSHIDGLLRAEVRVVNIGLKGFADDLRSRNTPVVHVDWSPPPAADETITKLLEKMGF